LAHNATNGEIALYIIITLVMLVAYVAAQVWYFLGARRAVARRVATEEGNGSGRASEKTKGDGALV
jgi:hypothetical protein